MKILQIVQKPQRRGAEIFAQQLSRQLRGEGHETRTVYLYAHDGENALTPDVQDHMLGGRERHGFETIPGIHPILLRRLLRAIDEVQPDVVQVNGGRTVKYGAAAALARRRRSWVLIYRNIGHPGYWLRGSRRAFYSHMVMPHLDGIVGISETTLQAIRVLYRLTVPTTRIPCAVDPGAVIPTLSRQVIRQQTNTPLDAPVIVWAGNLTDEKRIDRLLRATAVVRQSLTGLHAWIVGAGPLRTALETQARRSSLEHCVRFLGSQDQVANYMNAGDLVALTSDTEGMPAVLLEAGLLGLPVVATSVGGVPECVLNGRTGLLVQRADETGLADALRELLQQPERRTSLGQAAREWVERNFTMSRVAQQYVAFYQQVLTG